jgi:NAD(P)H-hydrate epimerase
MTLQEGCAMESITPAQMSAIEQACESIGISRRLLMESAGSGVVGYLLRRFKSLQHQKCLVICGTGNNGGDGFVVARNLSGMSAYVSVILLGSRDKIKTPEARTNWDILTRMPSIHLYTSDTQSEDELTHLVNEAEILVDAIFGTGVKGPIIGPYGWAIDTINSASAFKLAVDIPSGLDPYNGEVHDKVVKADATVTFHRVKRGLALRPEVAGEIIVVPIGVPMEAEEAVKLP